MSEIFQEIPLTHKPRVRQVSAKKVVYENKTFRYLVQRISNDYKVDSHQVQTEDGYILKVFRIRGVGTKARPSRLGEGKPKPAVFLQHGYTSSSETFVQSNEDSLAL